MIAFVLAIKTVSAAESSGELKELYDEIKGKFGAVPDFFQVLSIMPKTLRVFWEAYEQVIFNSSFPEKVRGMIRYEVAKADGCPLCKDGHQDLLRMYGLSDEEIYLLDKEIRETKYDDKTKNILIFSYSVASNPHAESKVVEAFKGLGLRDEEILEITAIVHIHKALLDIAHSLSFHRIDYLKE